MVHVCILSNLTLTIKQLFSATFWEKKPLKTQTTPNPPRGTVLGKFSTVGNMYFHLFKWGKITTRQEVRAISAEYERSTKTHGAY